MNREKFIKGVPVRFEPAKGKPNLNGVIIETDDSERVGELLKVRQFRRVNI